MLNKLQRWINDNFLTPEHPTASNKNTVALASAALMVEVARIDQDFSAHELAHLQHLFAAKLNIQAAELEQFHQRIMSRVQNSTSLYEFTRVINDSCSPEEKFELIHAMWEVAYADGHLDKYEEHVIRKVADLIYVEHTEFMRAKWTAKEKINRKDDRE